MESNKVKLQWEKAAKSWIEFIRGGENIYSDYLNAPALMRMLGEVDGKRVLDMGCGEGYASRILAGAGANVIGVDISDRLIDAALEEEARYPQGIEYISADAANIHMFEDESFDIVTCYMAMMDMANHEKVISEASRVLKTGGRYIIVMEHPCFGTRFVDGRMISGWKTRLHEEGRKEYIRYRIEDYLHNHSYAFEWKHDRLSYHFVTTGFHRTLSDYVNEMSKNGLVITGMDEPQPMDEGIRVQPSMDKHLRIPQSIVIEATKLFAVDVS